MPEGPHASGSTRSAAERLRAVLYAPRRFPQETLVVVRDVLLTTVGVTLVLHVGIWDVLNAAVVEALQHGQDSVLYGLASTPFDLVVFQATVGLVVGLLVGLARSWTYYWNRRRRQSGVQYGWRTVSPVLGFLAVGALVFASATVGSVLLALSVLSEPVAAAELLPAAFQRLRVVPMTNLVAWFGVAVGIGSLLAYVPTVFAIEDVAAFDSLALGGAAGAVLTSGIGVVLRSGSVYAGLVWTGPILAGYAVGLLLALLVGRR